MRTLIYCRVSSVAQLDGSSLESQASACTKYAEENNLSVIRTVKEVFSGAYLFDRPKLNEIRDEVRAGKWDAIVIYAIDRLTRNIAHLMILSEECERYGVALHFVTESLDNSPEGKLLQSVRGYVGEVEREKIRERTMRGRRTKALNGTLSYGRRLYGYNVFDGKRAVCSVEAPVVVSLFKRVIAGESLREIASDLNARNVPTPQGRPGSVWWANSIAVILKNPAYAGRSVAFRYKHNSKMLSGTRSTTCSTTDPESWVDLPEGTTPALVDQSTFDDVQAVLTKNKSSKRARVKLPYLLRGMVRCGVCGRMMTPQTSHSRHRAYVCSSKQNPTTNCGVKMLAAEKSERVVWDDIVTLIRDPDALRQRIIASSNSSNADALHKELHSISSSIALTESQMKKIVTRAGALDDSMWSMFEKELRAKQSEIDNLKVLQRTVSDELDALNVSVIDLTKFEKNRLRMIRTLDKMTFENRVELLKELGLGITWNGSRIKASVYRHYGCKSNIKSFDNTTVTFTISPK